MQIEFLGAAREVTGSCHYVSFSDVHLLVDCGMQQGPDLYENQQIPVNPSEIDYIFVTHAHIDHSGLLPLLYKNGFRGWIYATKATMDLCQIMLLDSAHIQQSEAEWKNRKAQRAGEEAVEPMYDTDDVLGVMKQFIPCEYGKKRDICEGLSVRFSDAGHLLGSASIMMWLREGGVTKKIAFSGDLGNGNRPMLKDPSYITDADYVLIESTYGDSDHETPPDYAKQLAQVIEETMDKGGNLVIPAFSVGRTQELLYYIRRIKSEGLLRRYPDFEVYVDSPLAVEATSIFTKNERDCYNERDLALIDQGINPIQFPGLKIAVTSDESRAINFMPQPKVIISASGMCEAGRIRHHLKHNLWRPESTVLFVGYQVPGTLGHSLLNGAKTVRLFGEEIEVQADIVRLPGMSGHADRAHLLKWMSAFTQKPKLVFVVHGEEDVAEGFAKEITARFDVLAVAPYPGDGYDLLTGERVLVGSRRLAVSKSKETKKARVSAVYGRLLSAGERLMTIIKKSKGCANKDLAKFADQVTTLCNKWDR